MLVIELLGTLSLRADTGAVPLVAQQKRPLGLLAVLALGGKQGLSRHRVESYLWPESDAERAGHALNQAVYAIRQSLGDDVILSTTQDLRLNPQLVGVDVWFFDEAIVAKDWARAASIYKGTLLDGVHLGDSRELESLIDANRTRLRQDYHNAVECLANASAEADDHSQSVIWCRRLANSDPLSPRATKKLMLALAAAGDRAAALKQARFYQELVRQELEMEPDSEIEALAASISRSANSEQREAGGGRGEARTRKDVDKSAGVGDPPGKPSTDSLTPNRKPGRSRARLALFAAIPIVVLLTAAAILGRIRPADSKPVVRNRLVVDSTEAIAKVSSWSGRIALSRDGKLLAYIGGPRSQLLIRPRDQLHAIAMRGTEGVTNPFFSPDGKHVGFLDQGGVRIASIDGGPSISLTHGGPSTTVNDTLTGSAGASWGVDEMIYADNDGNTGLVRVEAKAGAIPTAFTRLDTASREFDHTWPDALPNGKGVLFTVTYSGETGVKGRSYALAVADIPSGKHRVIVQNAIFARYSSGHLLYVTDDKKLMVVSFDQSSMRLSGEPVAVTEGIRAGLGGSTDLAISATGTLVYSTGGYAGKQELVWVTRDGTAQAVDPEWSSEGLGFPALSPDGKSVAVTRSANNEPLKIWIKRLDRGPSIPLAGDGGQNFQPAWSPDGRSVMFTSSPAKGPTFLVSERADGAAPGVAQLRRTGNLFNAGWSPDGKWLIFMTDIAAPGAGDILAMRPGVDTAPIAVVATKFAEASPAISYNGRWLAYVSNESGRDEIYVSPFPNTRGLKWAVSTDGGIEPVWSHRGTELFYRDGSGNLVAVDVNADLTFSVGRSKILFPAAAYSSLRFTPQYAVARDDRRFLMIRVLQTKSADDIIVVDNWFEELKTARAVALPGGSRVEDQRH